MVEAQTIGLYDAVNTVMTNYPLIRQRQAEAAAASAHMHTVKDNLMPSLLLEEQLNAGTANPLQGSYFPLGIIPSTSGNSGTTDNNRVTSGNVAIAYLQWEFCNFGYYKETKKYAESQYEVNKAYLEKEKYLLRQEVISLYIDWLQKYRLMGIEKENTERALIILNAIRATVMSGLKPGVDSTTAAAVYAQAQIDYYNARNNVDQDRINLRSFLLNTVDNDLFIPDTNTVTSIKINQLETMYFTDSISTDHPLLQPFLKQFDLQLRQNKVTAKKYLPKMDLTGATWIRNSGISSTGIYPNDVMYGMPYSRYNYLAGLTVNFNVFDLQHRHDQLQEGKYEAEAAMEAMNTEKLALNRLMLQANSAYKSTHAKLMAIPVQFDAAQQAYIQQTALYRAGLNTLLEVTNAQLALREAQINYVVTQGDLLQILYLRAELTGTSEIFIQNFKP